MRREVKVNMSKGHQDQIKGAMEQIKQLKLEVADLELTKLTKLSRIQQEGQRINALIQNFPQVYDVPADATVNTETGEIVGFVDDLPDPPKGKPSGPPCEDIGENKI